MYFMVLFTEIKKNLRYYAYNYIEAIDWAKSNTKSKE